MSEETYSRPRKSKTEREERKKEGKKRKRKKKKEACSENTYYLGMEERQGLVHVLDFVNSHASVVGLGQSFAGDDLQQFEQFFAICEVGEQIVHLHARLKKSNRISI